MASKESLNENVFIDFECKDVKVQPTSLSVRKTEYQNVQSIVKVEKENPTNDIEENVLIDFECKDVKFDFKSQSAVTCKSEHQNFQPDLKKHNEKNPFNYANEKRLIILIKKGFNYDNNYQLNTDSDLQQSENKKLGNVNFNSSSKSKVGRKTNTVLASTKKLINPKLKSLIQYECAVCCKSFSFKGHLKRHINLEHGQNKPFECEICHKSFSVRSYLQKHINGVHKRVKRFECEICAKSFSYKGCLKTHLNAFHKRSKLFKCDICHVSFAWEHNLNSHISVVHDRSKPFECDTCHKSFGQKEVLGRIGLPPNVPTEIEFGLQRVSIRCWLRLARVSARLF
uniref:C2H2-type domain-containing protein n=1 Tax=Trichogramma kaykai TaxID=54128 RepID=A0ABD2XQ11_9HYME